MPDFMVKVDRDGLIAEKMKRKKAEKQNRNSKKAIPLV